MSYVLKMIAEGEHLHQDFKTRVEDARKIARTLAAFANTAGGRLLVGVRDNGTVCGVQAEEEYHMIQAAATMHCKPAVPFEIQVWKAELRTVLEVKVPRSVGRPHFCDDEQGRWNAWLRREDCNHKASPVLVRVWQYEMRRERSEFRYDAYVGKLFARWREGRVLQFRQVCRYARLEPYAAEELLALLIVWGIVATEPTPRGYTYALADEAALDRLETDGPHAWRYAG